MLFKLTAILFIVLSAATLAAAQLDLSAMQDPGHKAFAHVAGVKFSVPNEFELHQTVPAADIAYMYDARNKLGIYVAVPGKQPDDAYITSLTNTLAALALPKMTDIQWKYVPFDEETGASKFQTAAGVVKGLSGKNYIQIDYVAVKVDSRDVLIGYVTQLGSFPGANAKDLFEEEVAGGLSMPGRYAQAHVIASVTGEKYREINPGNKVALPIPKKENHPSVDRLLYRAKKPGQVDNN